MKYTLRWGPMGCVVSPTKVIPLSDFKTSYTLKEESGTDTSGSDAVIQKGRELQPVSFTIVYAKATGNDPLARLVDWSRLIGQSYPLYLGGKRFGPKTMTLKQVDLSECLLGNDGSMIQAKVSISLMEHSVGTTKKASTKKGESTKSSSNEIPSSSESSAASAYNKAINTTASQAEKERLKTDIQRRR